GRGVDRFFEKNLLEFDRARSAADEIYLPVWCHRFSNVGAFPARSEVDALLPQVKNPVGGIGTRALADVRDHLDHVLAEGITQVEEILTDELAIASVPRARTVGVEDEEIRRRGLPPRVGDVEFLEGV